MDFMRQIIPIIVLIVAWCLGKWLRTANQKALDREKLEGLPDVRNLPLPMRLRIGQKMIGLSLLISSPFIVWIVWTDPDSERTPLWLIGTAFLLTMILATAAMNALRKRLLRSAGGQTELASGRTPEVKNRQALTQTGLFMLGVVIVSGAVAMVFERRIADSSSAESPSDFSNCMGNRGEIGSQPPAQKEVDGRPGSAAATAGPRSRVARASRVPKAPTDVRVYFVPIGALADVDTERLVLYYQQKFDLSVTMLPAIMLDDCALNTRRRQYQAEELIKSLWAEYPELSKDRESILIGITEADIYIRQENWRFAFALREGGRFAVVSSARMNLRRSDSNAQVGTLGSQIRLVKMISREIGFMYYTLPPSPDPQSVVRSSIMSLEDLDQVGEEF